MPAGRPTKYKEKYPQMLIDHMKDGLSYTTFAATIDVSIECLYEWERKHAKFSEAKKIGQLHSQLFWEKMGRAGTAGKMKFFNSTAWIYNMKNRFRKSPDWSPIEEENNSVTFNIKYDPKQLDE